MHPSKVENTITESRIAASCLVHPCSLLALFLLAFNDHLLKGVGPTWITGKLSDVAGLFYFPFLLIVFTAFLPRRFSDRPGLSIGKFVFWAVGIWFAAAKMVPIVHFATVRLAEVIVGDVQVVFDPSDAWATIALFPAWQLYRYVATSRPHSLRTRLKPAVIISAILLTAATSRPHVPSAHSIIVHDEQLYVVVGDENGTEFRWNKYYSTPDGVHWTAATLPRSVVEKHQRDSDLGVGTSALKLWGHIIMVDNRVSWSISDGRQKFMTVMGGDNWKTFDIATVPKRPDVVVVALGTEGIVVRNSDGRWARRGIGEVMPTPQRVSVNESISLFWRGQWLFGAAAVLLTWALLSLLNWCSASYGLLPLARARKARITLTETICNIPKNAYKTLRLLQVNSGYLILAGMVAFLLAFITLISPPSPLGAGNSFLPIGIVFALFLVVSVVVMSVGWSRFRKKNKGHDARISLSLFLSGVSSSVSLVLWDIGLLEAFGTVLSISVASIFVLAIVHAAKISAGEKAD